MTNRELAKIAIEMRNQAYAPYSDFQVGAALLTVDGKLFTGCNVENSSYGLSICAERTAICKAVSEGEQVFEKIAVAASPQATPCGACRQFIFEFGSQIEVICVAADQLDSMRSWTIEELLPNGFRFK
ncbi:MAG: cytidine deaminase [Planctomycetota bacterium]